MIQKVKDKEWINESNQKVPVEYISPGNRLKEHHAGVLLKQSKDVNKRLTNLKKNAFKLCQEVYVKMMEEFKVNPDGKGNFTWFNFDRSLKFEVSINDIIVFDDLTIKACKEKFDEFLKLNVEAKNEFVKLMVTDAFSTSNGKLDVKKLINMLKWRKKVNEPLFDEALDLLEQGITRPNSKTYIRIFERQEDGSYSLIDLNFSSI